MAEEERSPLLSAPDNAPGSSKDADSVSEATPLLSSSAATPRYDGEADEQASQTSQEPAPEAAAEPKRSAVRWPSIIAILILTVLAVLILVLGFYVPSRVEDYAKQAAVIEPTGLSVESITDAGVRARVQANFRLDGQKVDDDGTRRVGRFVTGLVRRLHTEEAEVAVYLPEFDNALLGRARVPGLSVSIVSGDNTVIDFVTELAPGDVDGIRKVANLWLEGKLDHLRVLGKTDISVRTGIFPLGTHSVAERLTFEAKDAPSMPSYNLTNLDIKDVKDPKTGKDAIGAEVSVTAGNKYPIHMRIPPVDFEILVPNCRPHDDLIPVAETTSDAVEVFPRSNVTASAFGLVRSIPEELKRICPGSRFSPFDRLLEKYLDGTGATVYVRGQKSGDSEAPAWVQDILASVAVPVALPAGEFDDFVKNFTVADLNFKLPGFGGEPAGDDDNPRVSGTIEVLAAIPRGINFGFNVTSLKAQADVFYKKQKLGELNLSRWQRSNSTRIPAGNETDAMVKIFAKVKDVPLNITDADVFADVIQQLLFGGKKVMLDMKASVDGKVNTCLGELVLKGVPTKGRIPVKPIRGNGLDGLQPILTDIKITDTTESAINLAATVNITNPTPYTASIPFINLHVYKNGTLMGNATAENLELTTGENANVHVTGIWEPSAAGEAGRAIGRDLISQYLSAYNISVTVKTHRGSIPSVPVIGDSLSRLNLTITAPKLSIPGNDPSEDSHFIRNATFHILSSTAAFTLMSPFRHDILYIESVNATALYNHTEPVGRIVYATPFPALPGASDTPKLPVQWSLGSIGYDKMRKALGGELRLDARANVTLRTGSFRETVWYEGRSIGAKIKW